MSRKADHSFAQDFKTFFFRGLAIVLPTVLTIWLVVIAYTFVQEKIASPINAGVRESVIVFSDWPQPTDADFREVYAPDNGYMSQAQRDIWEQRRDLLEQERERPLTKAEEIQESLAWMKAESDIVRLARRHAFENWWDNIRIGNWRVLNLIGLVVAIVLVYFIGIILGSFIGRRLLHRGEALVDKVPLVRRVYPSVKQVTDFFVGDSQQKMAFSQVVAVQYPRKGLWSVGLVTGDTMRAIQDDAGVDCMTVFIPSSPTPFTGYVITVPKKETINLPITIEDALKFAISGGVLVPPNQVLQPGDAPGPDGIRGKWRKIIGTKGEEAGDAVPEGTPADGEEASKPPVEQTTGSEAE